MNFDNHGYSLATYYIPAIIYGDHSGLTDTEERDLYAFLEHVTDTLGPGHWTLEPDSQAFMTDEATGIDGDCCLFYYWVPKKSA